MDIGYAAEAAIACRNYVFCALNLKKAFLVYEIYKYNLNSRGREKWHEIRDRSSRQKM